MNALVKSVMAGLVLAISAMNGTAESVADPAANPVADSVAESVAEPANTSTFVEQVAVEKAQMVNINTADAQTIAATLKGIGLQKAEAIVAHRTQHGEFKSLEELADVKGIGAATLEKNAGSISF